MAHNLKEKKRIILLSNDDGVNSPGLTHLREGIIHMGDVYTIAPHFEMSGASHSVTLRKPIEVKRLSKREFAVKGTPVDCIFIGIFDILPRKPDLVISGINPGYNLGEDVFYSGTVAAAREGAFYGIPSIAVSLQKNDSPFFWDTAVEFTRIFAHKLLKGELPLLLNLNIPNITLSEIKGVRFVKLGKRYYKNPVKRNKKGYFEIGGEPLFDAEPMTDINAVMEGYVACTPLLVDLTDYNGLKGKEEKRPL